MGARAHKQYDTGAFVFFSPLVFFSTAVWVLRSDNIVREGWLSLSLGQTFPKPPCSVIWEFSLPVFWKKFERWKTIAPPPPRATNSTIFTAFPNIATILVLVACPQGSTGEKINNKKMTYSRDPGRGGGGGVCGNQVEHEYEQQKINKCFFRNFVHKSRPALFFVFFCVFILKLGKESVGGGFRFFICLSSNPRMPPPTPCFGGNWLFIFFRARGGGGCVNISCVSHSGTRAGGDSKQNTRRTKKKRRRCSLYFY